MSHEIESMAYNMENGVPWHGLGEAVDGAMDGEAALVRSGLMWGVEKRSIYVDGQEVPGFAATVRTTDDKVLGVVGERYRIVQNREAFAWTDALLGEGVKYETAGSLRGGKRVWMLARIEEPFKVAGDDTFTYLCFTNSHDGTSAVRVALTPIRVVWANTLAWALKGTKRTWSAAHTGNLQDKLTAAREALQLTRRYMTQFAEDGDRLVEKQMDLEEYVECLWPLPDQAKKRAIANIEERRKEIMDRAEVENLKPFEGSAWQFVQAVADYVSHAEP